jgi:hypothetical protein
MMQIKQIDEILINYRCNWKDNSNFERNRFGSIMGHIINTLGAHSTNDLIISTVSLLHNLAAAII